VGYETRDLLEAMRADWQGGRNGQGGGGVLRVDGGMSASDWAMQFLSDIIGAPVDRPKVLETTALGAAWLAGMKAGVYPGRDEFAATWALERRFLPAMDETTRGAKYARWQRAVAATIGV
jgi:glycerol kinase